MEIGVIKCSSKAFTLYADEAEKCLSESNVEGEKPEDAEKFRMATKAFFHDCRALRQFYDWCKTLDAKVERKNNKHNIDLIVERLRNVDFSQYFGVDEVGMKYFEKEIFIEDIKKELGKSTK